MMSSMDQAPAAILVVADDAALTLWLRRLVDTLERVTLRPVALRIEAGAAMGGSLSMLYRLERMVLRRGRPSDAEPLSDKQWLDRLRRRDASAATLVIDLTAAGAGDLPEAVTALRPLYDGHAGENALAGAIFTRGTPQVAIERRQSGTATVVATGHASLETAAGVSGAVEAVKSRVLELLLKAIRLAGRPGEPIEVARQPASPVGNPAVAMRGARALAEMAARAAYRLCFHAPHWHVGWRFVEPGQDLFSRRNLGGTPWDRLKDQGDHFYADPFPLRHAGQDHIFFEDLDHKTGRGIISVCTFDADGRPGPTRPVMEEDCHLSYPFLVERDGQVFMIPETSERREVAIYRAADFPFRWEKLATLVSGVEAADATVFEQGGRWWMFAVTRDGIGGYSDTLAIWTAPDLFGPWLPHEQNPVLVDDRSARPAGWVIRSGETLYRPVQDCRLRYGGALSIARIDRLDDGGFAQTVEYTLSPDADWPGRRLHTLNYNGRLEVIDGEAPRLKWSAAR